MKSCEGSEAKNPASGHVAEGAAIFEPGYMATLWTAIANGKILAVTTIVSLIYLLVFTFASGILSRGEGPHFVDGRELPYFELSLDAIASVPHIAFQPLSSWYLEVNIIQAGELVIIGGLVAINVALTGIMWNYRNRSAGQASPALFAMAPFFMTNISCAACAGIPAGLAFLPTSLAGGLLVFARFYGFSAILVITTLFITVSYTIYKANGIHISHVTHNNSTVSRW